MQPFSRKHPAFFLSLALLLAPFFAHADLTEPRRLSLTTTGAEYNVSGKSFADRRFINVVRQKYDFSCGSAALATLLTYSYELPVDERMVLSDMYAKGNQAKIHKEGFSMLDMKNYLSSIGLKAEGYKESLDKLNVVGVPAIVLINRRGYTHFVVVKGVTKTKVLVGDPALGLRVYDRAEFEGMWNRILFVVTDLKPIARLHFNDKKLWAKKNIRLDSDFASLTNDTLGSRTLDLAPSPNYY